MSEDNEKKLSALEALQEFFNMFNESMKICEQEQEEYWNSLSHDEQLKAFCAVVRRIYQGEIEVNGSYRYVLYDVFGFGPESYAQAQLAGYLAIHNAIVTPEQEKQTLLQFCNKYGIEDAEEKIRNMWL